LIIYQHASLIILAERIAEKSAYSWDNSYKQITSGTLDSAARDGLYWRLTSDGAVPFLSGGMGKKLILHIPDDGDHQGQPALIVKKLLRSSSLLTSTSGVEGEISYENRWIERQINVRLQRSLRL